MSLSCVKYFILYNMKKMHKSIAGQRFFLELSQENIAYLAKIYL